MLRESISIILGSILLFSNVLAQQNSLENDTELIKGTFLGKTPPVRDFATEFDFSQIDTNQYFEIRNFKDRYRTGPIERNLNPKLDPIWKPNQNTSTQRVPQGSIIQNYNGIGFTGVQPPDPCVAVSSEYVVQMINGSGGAKYKVWNKTSNSLTGALNVDDLFLGYNGLGDPIVVYDRIADRWLLSEFASSGSNLLVAISVTNDPLGQFYTYVFQANNFPDYPKYSVWPDAYYCTTNESQTTIYAFERDSMLVGAPAILIRKTVPSLSGFGFQALTPVNFEGVASSNTPATFWRHVDDEAHSNTPDPFSDFVQYWTFTPNFSSPSSSPFVGPTTLTVSEFDSDLNGYFAFSAIKQPNSTTRLDPLREVFMNRMNYRNFGIFESIVGCHVTDIDGSDWAGMRWYEFRKTDTSNWTLYQEGTYAPDADSRWMGSIDINANGSICLAYSVSSSTTYPSLKFTGRNVWDSPGVMTLTEQTIVAGGGSNSNNRYGDYAAMVVDPADDSTFWFTGEYNPSSTWSTRIAQLQLNDICNGLTATAHQTAYISCPNDSNAEVEIFAIGGNSGTYTYSVDSVIFQSSNVLSNLTAGDFVIYVKDGTCVSQVPISIVGPDTFQINTTLSNIDCYGNANGNIIVSGNGGTSPIQYSLDNMNWVNSTLFDSLTAGNYTVYIRDANNCISQKDSNIITEPLPLIVTDSIVPASSSSATDGAIYLDVQGGTPIYYYSKDSLSFTSSNYFTNLAAGTYFVYVVDANGCLVKDTVNINSVSVPTIFNENNVRLFPNPNAGKFNIELGSELLANGADLVIRNLTGQIVYTHTIESQNSNFIESIDISKNATGVYFMIITVNSQTHTLQIVME